jgi:hypothetical protein
MDSFEAWWDEHGDDETDDRALCSRAWEAGNDYCRKTCLRPWIADAYHRGRRNMLFCWLIGVAGAVVLYFTMKVYG